MRIVVTPESDRRHQFRSRILKTMRVIEDASNELPLERTAIQISRNFNGAVSIFFKCHVSIRNLYQDNLPGILEIYRSSLLFRCMTV